MVIFCDCAFLLIFESQTYDVERGSRSRERHLTQPMWCGANANFEEEEVANYAHNAHDCKIIILFEIRPHCFSHCLTDVVANFCLFTCTNYTCQMDKVKSQGKKWPRAPCSVKTSMEPLHPAYWGTLCSSYLGIMLHVSSLFHFGQVKTDILIWLLHYAISHSFNNTWIGSPLGFILQEERLVRVRAHLWMNRSNTVKDSTYHAGENRPGRSGQDSLAKTTLIILINIPKVIKIFCEPST